MAILLILYMIWLAHHDTLTNETVVSENVPEAFHDFTIFFIADIHRRTIREQTIYSFETTVDAVFIGGDLIERGVSFERMVANIRTLKHYQAPIYFVWGNNDYETVPKKIIDLLTAEKVIILEDTVHKIHRGSEYLNLVGFDFYYDKQSQPLVNWQLVDQSYTILLAHKPSAYEHLHADERAKIDLVLAGHTHGGQIRLFGFGLYKNGGFSKMDHTTLFVTEGYGYTLLPFRLGTKSQCHLITLKHINNV